MSRGRTALRSPAERFFRHRDGFPDAANRNARALDERGNPPVPMAAASQRRFLHRIADCHLRFPGPPLLPVPVKTGAADARYLA